MSIGLANDDRLEDQSVEIGDALCMWSATTIPEAACGGGYARVKRVRHALNYDSCLIDRRAGLW